MHVIKPMALGLSSRPIEFRKRFGLAVSGLLHVPFAQSASATLWSEQSMWDFLAREMAVPLIDEGVPKLTSEFLVHGHAYTTPGRRDAVAVRVRLGAREKVALVFGDRVWQGRRATAPLPFESLPLSWERAYGGPGFAANPVGRGHEPVDGVHPLPNFELPGARVDRPGVPVTPAGFGALDVMHPQRASRRGTYDEAWLHEHSPGFAPDVDWRHFNMAPQDQWLEQPLSGVEPFELDHLHPSKPAIRGRLPGLRVRAFASYRAATDARDPYLLREVPMRLTTVWFFAHAERMVLVFHGLAECADPDGDDIARLMGAVDRVGPGRPPEHFLEVLKRRLDPKLAMVHALNDADLTPEGLDLVDPEVILAQERLKPDALRERAQYRRARVDVEMARDMVRAQGKDPDALGIRLAPMEKPPTPAELPAYLERIQAELSKQKWSIIEEAVTHAENALDLARFAKGDLSRLVHRGPPTFRAQEQLDEIAKGFALGGVPFDRATMAKPLQQQEMLHQLDYLLKAHTQPPAPRLQGEAAAAARAEVLFLLKRGVKAWPGIDLTGVDLSRLDLSGIDLSGAWLESADLRESVLVGTNFTGAVLAHADLRGSDATRARFVGANVGRSKLARATLDEADFSLALMNHCALEQTQLRRARLRKTDLGDTTWGRANWRGVVGRELLFYKLDLRGMAWPQADFEGTNFIECDLRGVDFRAARLPGCSFVRCKADGARFSQAVLPGATFVDGTTLQAADFTGAELKGANLGECDLRQARLARANLEAANLAKAQLEGSQAQEVRVAGALLRKAVLRRALWTGADLRNAILQYADLRSADLRSCNLYGADLSRVQRDSATLMIGSLADRARVWPRLPLAPLEPT